MSVRSHQRQKNLDMPCLFVLVSDSVVWREVIDYHDYHASRASRFMVNASITSVRASSRCIGAAAVGTADLRTGRVSARAGAERAAQSSRSEFTVYTRARW